MRITKSKVLLCVGGGLLVGIVFGSVKAVAMYWSFVCVASAIAALCVLATRRSFGHQQGVLSVGFVWFFWVLAGFGIGLWRITQVMSVANQYEPLLSQKQDFEGTITTEPDVRLDKQLLTVRPDGFSQQVLITTTLSSYYQYGDRVWVQGKLVPPKEFDDFDYPGYLARFNTYALSRYPKIVVLHTNTANHLTYKLLQVKALLAAHVLQFYNADQGNLLLGILIGAKKGLSSEATEAFARTGTSHIMAVSGFNISIFITSLAYIAFLIGRRLQLLVSIACIIVFIIMAGPSASVVRAAGMGSLVMLSIASGRLYSPLPSLVCVAAVMALINPRIVYWDIGFQLSAAATVGILLGMPLLSQLRERVGNWYKLLEPFGVTMAAILATLPISVWHFSSVSIVAPFVNMVVVPLVPIAMGFGALSFLPYAGPGFAWINSAVLEVILSVVTRAAKLSWASTTAHLSGIAVLWLYVAGTALYLLLRYVMRNKLSNA